MRARRPYLFSDTCASVEYALTREVLANHLETITARNEENIFERFARRLAEVEVCPNLRPNTGPSGGGDGKVDTETYPVSPEIAALWYYGEPEAASERWAFAISAKREWKGKVRSDVEKVVGTCRGYTRIYFITSRNARAKERADIEEALEKQYGIPVTILDQSWILERVFEHGRVALAVNALGMTGSMQQQAVETGSKGRERIDDLAVLDARISEYTGSPNDIAEDMLEAALLVRGLERPRAEIDGRFFQARRAAKKARNCVLEFNIVYNWAWTANFWFDDFEELANLYDDAAALIEDLRNAELISRLTNLWSIMRMAVSAGVLNEKRAKIPDHNAALKRMLAEIAGDDERPNSALHARAIQLFVEMINRCHDQPGESMDDVWNGLREVLEASQGYGTFPFEEMVDSLSELGPYIKHSEPFDHLYAEMAELQAKRRGDGEAAAMLAGRAWQKLGQDEPYAAIRWFGKGIDRLVKKEFEGELLSALGGLSVAYDKAGLKWAARIALAVTSHQVTAGLMVEGSFSGLSPTMLQGFYQMELSLGRVGHAMLCHQLELIVRGVRGSDHDELYKLRQGNAMLMSTLLVRTPFDRLDDLTQLPSVFDQFALYEANMPVMFLLGQLDQLREEGAILEGMTDAEVNELMMQFWQAGKERGIENEPKLTIDDLRILSTRVLGIELTLEADPSPKAIQIAESVLGVVESFLATSLGYRSLPNVDRMTIRVSASEGHRGAPTISFDNVNDVVEGVVTYAPAFESSSKSDASGFKDFCHHALVEIIERIATFADPEKWITKLAEDERVFDRALIFCNVPAMTDNVFGADVPLPLALAEVEPAVFENLRKEAWHPAEAVGAPQPRTFGKGEPPPGIFDLKHASHAAYQVRSPIEVEKWNRAQWNGTVFMYARLPEEAVPCLGLAFENREPAEEIFAGWHARIGPDDGTLHLRIMILRGVDNQDPNTYGLSVGPHMHLGDELKEEHIYGYVTRQNRMYPASSANLDGFLSAYEKVGQFLLVPFHLPDKREAPIPIPVKPIPMTRLDVRAAWEVGENDLDIMALRADDKPFIPDGVKEAPVLRALARIRQMRGPR